MNKPKNKNLTISEQKVDSSDELMTVLKKYYVSILSFFLVLISFFLVFLPQLNDIFSLKNQMSRQNKDFESYENKLTLLSELSEADLNSQIRLVEIALPSSKPAFSTLEILQGVSKRFDMSVTNFDFSPGLLATESSTLKKRSNSAMKIQNLDSIFVDVDMEGDHENLLEFVDYLENSLPIVDISSISFSTDVDESGVSATLSMIVYFSPLPDKIGKISDPIKEISSSEIDIYEKIITYPKITTRSTPFTTRDIRNNPFDY